MQSLYAYYKNDDTTSINEIEKELFFSINKSYDLYHYLLVLIIEVANLAEKRLEKAQNKKLPTPEDLNPNRKFIDNSLINNLRINNSLLRYLEINKLSWVNNPQLIKGILDEITQSKSYNEYMNDEKSNYASDKKFIIDVYTKIISTYEPLYTTLEEQSIFWNDEVEFIISSIIKTLKKIDSENAEDAKLLPLYKNEEDRDFTKNLFRKTILHRNEFQDLIQKFSKNWDAERIAFIDTLLIDMALTEVLYFDNIPVKVSFNEYIELSKYYSTNRSNIFINGLLDKIINNLKKENKIKKIGRGLIGEV